MTRLWISWNVYFNLGPLTNKPSCQMCRKIIARNHHSLCRGTCGFQCHIKCGKVTPTQFVKISRDDILPWKYLACLQQFELDYSDWIRIHCRHFPSLQCDSNHGETKIEGEECGQCRSHLLNLARQPEACSRKDLRVSAEPAPLK